MVRFVRRILIGAVLAYGALIAGLWLAKDVLLFPRDTARVAPQAAGLPGLSETTLQTEDGETLVAWVVPPQAGRPVVLYFHGNAGNFARPERLARLRAYVGAGFGLFAVSYRGYGGSSGVPSEAGLHADARAAHAAAVQRFAATPLVLHGESLGTGVATVLATTHAATALVLEAPYTSITDGAVSWFPFVPRAVAAAALGDPLRTVDRIGEVKVPLLIVHGTADRILPVGMGRALFAAATAPRRFVEIEGAGHEDLAAFGLVGHVERFLADVAAGRLAGAEVVRVTGPRP